MEEMIKFILIVSVVMFTIILLDARWKWRELREERKSLDGAWQEYFEKRKSSHPANTAYILYVSGMTKEIKGVKEIDENGGEGDLLILYDAYGQIIHIIKKSEIVDIEIERECASVITKGVD